MKKIIPQSIRFTCDICESPINRIDELHNKIEITKISNIYEDDSGPYIGDSRPIVTSLDLCDNCFEELEIHIAHTRGLYL